MTWAVGPWDSWDVMVLGGKCDLGCGTLGVCGWVYLGLGIRQGVYWRGCGNLGEGLCGLVQEVYLGMDEVVMGLTGRTGRMGVDVLGVAVAVTWGGGGGALLGGDGEGVVKEDLTKAMPLLV